MLPDDAEIIEVHQPITIDVRSRIVARLPFPTSESFHNNLQIGAVDDAVAVDVTDQPIGGATADNQIHRRPRSNAGAGRGALADDIARRYRRAALRGHGADH